MKTVKKFAAQGDVMFRRVSALPDGFEPTDDNVVAHSETGHNHVAVGALQRYENTADPMISYIVAKGPVEIEHHRPWDTHEKLKLLNDGPGETVWEIRRQREHTPEGWQMVMD